MYYKGYYLKSFNLQLQYILMCLLHFDVCNRVEYDYYKYHPMPEVRTPDHCSHTHYFDTHTHTDTLMNNYAPLYRSKTGWLRLRRITLMS